MSTDTAVDTEETDVVETDGVREAVAKAFADELGAGYLESHINPGRDLWIRVDRDSWVQAARFAKDRLGMTWLDWVSAIDWMPSPFGRDMDAEQDFGIEQDSGDSGDSNDDAQEQTTGLAGGDTRFQMVLRLYSIEEAIGVTIKADLADDDLSIDTLIPVFAGANWHERELWEMFGINVAGHPDLRALYLPSGFEGNPLRKDYPLVARRVKPWPGIVDVEQMPDEDEQEEGDS